jgi:hypothetical protein
VGGFHTPCVVTAAVRQLLAALLLCSMLWCAVLTDLVCCAVLCCRWVTAAPASWLCRSLVPASLADTLAAAAADEALALLLPQLRAAAQPVLGQLRPGTLQVRSSTVTKRGVVCKQQCREITCSAKCLAQWDNMHPHMWPGKTSNQSI